MKPTHHGETVCPQCGADAHWSEGSGDSVEITCPTCGRLTVTRAQFDEFSAGLPPEEDRL